MDGTKWACDVLLLSMRGVRRQTTTTTERRRYLLLSRREVVHRPCNTEHCTLLRVPAGSPSSGGDVAVYVFLHKPTGLAHSFLFCSCVYFCLYGPFTCISFHQFSRQLSAFSLCSSANTSALLVLSTIYLLIEVSFSPDIISFG